MPGAIDMKKTLAIIALVIALAALYFGLRQRSSMQPHAASQAKAAIAAEDDLPATSAVLQTLTAAPPHPINPSAPDLRAAFEYEDDLYALMVANANSKEPEALWLIAKIAEFCSDFGLNPSGYDANTANLVAHLRVDTNSYREARSRLKHRCRGFEIKDAKHIVGIPAQIAHKTVAARSGNLAAEASLVSWRHPLSIEPGYAQGLIDRILDSRDPDAYAEISAAVASNPDIAAIVERRLGLRLADSESNQYAFLLAACRLGRDCSHGGAMMTYLCATSFICGESMGFERWLSTQKPSLADFERIRRLSIVLASQKKGE